MNLTVLFILAALCAALMWFERRGLRTTLALTMKGDVKRETRWLAQYGQSVCTGVAALLVFQLDPRPTRGRAALTVIGGVLAASVASLLLKRLLSRVRPGHDNAGKFLGPSWKHANYRESFPSSHSACAMALSVILASFYPAASVTFWGLALSCAALRYVLDAHWPSDVVGGVALGYAVGHVAVDVVKLG
jgi:membrane-associated phospholipid phosphatase